MNKSKLRGKLLQIWLLILVFTLGLWVVGSGVGIIWVRTATADDGGDGRGEGGSEVGIGCDRRRCRAESVGEGGLRWWRRVRSIINVLRHLETRKLGLIVEGLRGGDGERDLEVRRRSLVLQCVG